MSGLVVQQAAIDALCDNCDNVQAVCPHYPCKQYTAIEALPPAQQRWIPCNERLPEEDGQYLITVKYVHVDGYDDIYAEHGEWTDGKWDMFCFGHCGRVENIIAWMPLPEPWKEGEANE